MRKQEEKHVGIEGKHARKRKHRNGGKTTEGRGREEPLRERGENRVKENRGTVKGKRLGVRYGEHLKEKKERKNQWKMVK